MHPLQQPCVGASWCLPKGCASQCCPPWKENGPPEMTASWREWICKTRRPRLLTSWCGAMGLWCGAVPGCRQGAHFKVTEAKPQSPRLMLILQGKQASFKGDTVHHLHCYKSLHPDCSSTFSFHHLQEVASHWSQLGKQPDGLKEPPNSDGPWCYLSGQNNCLFCPLCSSHFSYHHRTG